MEYALNNGLVSPGHAGRPVSSGDNAEALRRRKILISAIDIDRLRDFVKITVMCFASLSIYYERFNDIDVEGESGGV